MSIRKATLFAGSMLFTVAAAGHAAAQTTNSQGQQSPTVVVTGSRIPKPNLDQPVPVQVITPQLIQNAGGADLGALIATLPSMGVQSTVRANANSFGNAGGLAFADLRNLGFNRTLTLVDGQRHVAADPGSFAVDLGSIPPALVDRVEIVTGGASAIYGSDALAGVVNIILKKQFQGVEGEIQGAGYPDGNYGWNESGYLTVGRNFANDRGNVVISAMWDANQQVLANQVPGDHNFGLIVNPIYGAGPPAAVNGIPQFFIAPNVESEFINNTGVLVDAATAGIISTFTANGAPIPQQSRIATNSFAFGEFKPDCNTCFKLEDYELIIPKTDRVGGDIRLTYDITPHLNFNVDEKLIQQEVYDFNQPSIDFFGDGGVLSFVISPDNAFITPAIQGQLSKAIFPAIDRFFGDGGARTTFARRITERVVPQLKGDLDARFAQINWDATFNYGESRNYFSDRNTLITGNFNAAFNPIIDPATGKPACRINVAGAAPDPFVAIGINVAPAGIVGDPAKCVPYNPFGLQNNRAAINWFRRTVNESQQLYQEVATLNVNFDTSRFLNLPGGPIGIAAGLEWRKEHVSDTQDPLVSAGLTENAPTPNFAGGFEVSEAYAEANFPIFKHQGFLLDELTIDVADRNAQYTTVGNVNAWKVSGIYGPIPGLKFRADYSEAVRAPNITEAFLPPSGTFFTIADPCSIENISGNPNRAKNCAALGIPPGFVANTNLSPPGTVSGNSKLTPEQSKSYTLGFVLQPTFIKTLSLTVDYYNIDIKNAILLPTAPEIAANCVDGAGLDAQFCGLVTRNPVTHDITFIKDQYLNATELFTDGLEVQATYVFWADPLHLKLSTTNDLPGRVTVNADFNYLMHLHNFPFQQFPNTYIVQEGTLVPSGHEGTPYQRARFDINYAQGPVSLTWTLRYVGTAAEFNRSPGRPTYASNAVSPPYLSAIVYNDVVVHYRLPTWKGGTTDLFAGVNDLFNQPPPPNSITGNNGGPDGSALYDLGLYVFAGARVKY
jgi:iron complex outermembrane receptor protein